ARSTLLLGLAALVAVSACKKGEDEKTESETSGADSTAQAAGGGSVTLPVVGQTVRQGDLVLSVVTTAQVRSDGVVTLKSETAGPIVRVTVRPGERVSRGQPLVEVDPRELDLAVLQAQAALEDAKLKLLDNIVGDSIVSGKPVTGERLRSAEIRAGLDRAKADLEKAKLQRERATIAAPFDGVVDEIKVTVGERLANGQEIGRIVDLKNLRIEAAVLEHDLPFIKIGGEATITAAAVPDQPIRGRVAAILPLVDSATRAGRAVIRATGNGVLRPGMYADVRLEATRLPNRIVVPAAAVIERDGRPLVFVVKGGRAQWVYIFPGRTNGFETEVLADSASGQIPVVAGDTVLVEGHLTLTHDAPVKLVAKQERGNQ
ncbi:MAG: efflux RND transporter periplasmic adaptor subunit, partial [Gemmatimonadales bacterium]|nr:efflux RND transporter periplasmic adaptor subunit [Gemmatimonadales bacterium]